MFEAYTLYPVNPALSPSNTLCVTGKLRCQPTTNDIHHLLLTLHSMFIRCLAKRNHMLRIFLSLPYTIPFCTYIYKTLSMFSTLSLFYICFLSFVSIWLSLIIIWSYSLSYLSIKLYIPIHLKKKLKLYSGFSVCSQCSTLGNGIPTLRTRLPYTSI